MCTQETMPVSGVEATGADGTVSYTIGQLVYTNLTTTTGSLNQGIQQRLEFVTLSNLELMAIILIALTYPKLKTAWLWKEPYWNYKTLLTNNIKKYELLLLKVLSVTSLQRSCINIISSNFLIYNILYFLIIS